MSTAEDTTVEIAIAAHHAGNRLTHIEADLLVNEIAVLRDVQKRYNLLLEAMQKACGPQPGDANVTL